VVESFDAIGMTGDGIGRDRTGWPQNLRVLAGSLRRTQTSLWALGIEIAFSREGHAGSRSSESMRARDMPSAPSTSETDPQFFASHHCEGRLHPIADGADAKSPLTAQVVGVPDARLGEVGAAFVTLQGPRERGGADRVHQAPLRQFPRAALSGRGRELRCDRHDRQRQGAEAPVARACD
jgi:hypothetical protein